MIGNSETLGSAVEKLGSAVLLPVVDSEGHVLGICMRADVSAALAKGLPADTPVSGFSSSSQHSLSPDASLQIAAAEYLRSGLDQVPVVNADGELLGVFGLIEAASMLMRGDQA